MARFKRATAVTAVISTTLLLAACGGELTPSDYDDSGPLRTVSTSAQENDGTANGTSAGSTTTAGTGADGDTNNTTNNNGGVVVNVNVNQETTNTNTATNNNTAANGCCGGCCGYDCCCDCPTGPEEKPECGNGKEDPGEECDEGRICAPTGTDPSDLLVVDDTSRGGCPAGDVCVEDPVFSLNYVCMEDCTADGLCGGGEACLVPYWTMPSGDICDVDCAIGEPASYCGDGTVGLDENGLPEQCDPGPSLCIPSGHLQGEYWAAPNGSGSWSWNGLWGNTSADPCPGGGCAVGQECVVHRVGASTCSPSDTYACRPTCDQNALVPCAAASEFCAAVNRLAPTSTDGQHFCAFDCVEDTHTVCGP